MRRALAIVMVVLFPAGPFAASGPDVIARAIKLWRTRKVPYYLAEQDITRYIGTRDSDVWKRVDEITTDLRYDNRNHTKRLTRAPSGSTRRPSA